MIEGAAGPKLGLSVAKPSAGAHGVCRPDSDHVRLSASRPSLKPAGEIGQVAEADRLGDQTVGVWTITACCPADRCRC